MTTRRALGLLLAAVTLWVGFLNIATAQDTPKDEPEAQSPTGAFFGAVLTPETVAERVGTIVLILLLSYVAYRIIIGSLARAIRVAEEKSRGLPGAARQRQQRAVTIMSLVSNIVKWVISLVALIWILGALGINLIPLLTGVGFLGAAIAFGSQTLVRDVVSGFFVLLEGQYAVGDYVELGGKFGIVEEIGLRATLLRDLDNQSHYIPNGSIAASTVYEEHFVNYILRVPIADSADLDRAAEALQTVARTAQEQLPRYLLSVGTVEKYRSDTDISEIKLPFAIFPTQDWVATAELPTRAKAMFARHAIAMPEGMVPQAVNDLSAMPLVPVADQDPNSPDLEVDIISRWKSWVGTEAGGEDARVPE